MTYATIHNHTEYSNLKLIDSTNRAEEMIDYAIELGLGGIAITDHECVSGHHKAIKYFRQKYPDIKDFKLMLGNEIYLTNDGLNAESSFNSSDFNHFILIAKDAEGHRQIRELSSRAWKRSWMKKGILRTPTYLSDLYEVVEENPGHLIATTACLGGYTANCWKKIEFYKQDDLFSNGIDLQDISTFNSKLDNFLIAMSELFLNDFYIEIQPSRLSEDQLRYNSFMINKYWGRYNFVVATDSHYLKEEDREIHKWFLNSKEGEREVDAFYSSAYMMSAEELKDYLIFGGISEDKIECMFNNTLEIANKCEHYTLDKPQQVVQIPYEELEDYTNFIDDYENYEYINYYHTTDNKSDRYFYNLVCKGMSEKWKDHWDLDVYLTRLNEELEAIYKISQKIGKSLADYFTTMAKFIDLIWEKAESFVGPSRGSAGCFIVNYFLGITQMNPLEQELKMPSWRFLHESRPELPDIDFDTESGKRVKVFNVIKEYMESIGGDLVTICTFGTEKTKSAIKTAARGLQIPEEVVAFLNSMIPNERGFDWTLDQCYYGDEEHTAITRFKIEMDKYPMLWKVSRKIEGLITRLGSHASGVVAVNGSFVSDNNNSFMKTTTGQLVSAYELHDSEELSSIKYDMLTVSALDRIHQCFNYLLESKEIEWCGDLRSTYNKYLSPDSLIQKDEKMWDMVQKGQINSLFQFDTVVGSQAIKKIRPKSLTQLAISSSVMRLMSDGELPLETYARFKENIDYWYQECIMHCLNKQDVEILEPHLLPLSGVADSQESIMMISMDPHISGFTMEEANKLRKTIAKKKFKEIENIKQLFYSRGAECNASTELLDYVWNVQVSRQLGYSFSSVHTTGYAIMALQEMNLAYRYPIIYWDTACLSVDASAVNEQDFENLIIEGMMETSNEEDIRIQNKMDFSKVATAITKFKNTTKMELPNINKSKLGFTPNIENNTILYGLKGISTITAPVIEEIMLYRPFNSLQDFLNRTTKKVVNKAKVINLIKCGAFNEIEGKTSNEVLRDYLISTSGVKQKLTMQNARKLIELNLFPSEYEREILIYSLTVDFRKHRDADKFYYIISDVDVPEESYDLCCDLIRTYCVVKHISIENRECSVIESKVWDNKVYEPTKEILGKYIRANQEELLNKLNDILIADEWNKYVTNGIEDFELDSIGFYYTKHPLTPIIPQLPVHITSIDDLEEEVVDGYFTIKGKTIPKMKLYSIAGTVIDRDKTKGLVSLQTPEGVIEIKLYKDLFAIYNQALLDNNGEIIDNSFFDIGTHLLVTGILRGTTFVPKVYKTTGLKAIMKIIKDGTKFISLQEKMS